MSASRGRKCAEEAQFSLKVSTGVAIACIKSKTISQTTYTQLTNSTSIFSQTLLATQTQIEDQEKLNHHALAVVNPPTLEISQCSDDSSCEILDNAEAVDENMIIKLDLPRDETKKVIVIGRNNLDAHDSFEEDLLDVTMTSDKSADSQVEWYANKQQMSKLRPINATIERIARVEPLKPPRDAAVSISQSGPPSRASGRPRPIPVIRNAHPQQKIVRPVRQVKATVPPHCVRGRPRLTPKAPATAVDWRRMNKLETIGRTVQARKTRSHWSELIELQADWIRLVAVKSNINVSEIGFALNCWKIVTRNFTYAKNSFSVEIQKLTLMFLSNSIKILEITITKGHGEVQEQAINFLQIVLKKYIKNPLIMNDYNVSPIFPALQLIVNHTTSLKNLLVVYSSLIDIQSKYMTSWQKFNRTQAVTDQDINFFVYVLNEIDSLCKAANLRIQQQRRATMFHLSF